MIGMPMLVSPPNKAPAIKNNIITIDEESDQKDVEIIQSNQQTQHFQSQLMQ